MNRGNNNILVTGAAGFIGAALVKKLLKNGENVYGIDNINSYYSPKLKEKRLENIKQSASYNSCGRWSFKKISLEDNESIDKLFSSFRPNIVINLAAQAGVRYSLENPKSYISSNILGFFNIIDACRKYQIDNFIYASSSSVYGSNNKIPFRENQSVAQPLNLYAATKQSNELIAHSYSNLYGIATTGLRFFTVYGPWGRPDMAPMLFTKSILCREPIRVFNFGKMRRDFTYIDDIVEAVFRCCYKPINVYSNIDSQNMVVNQTITPHRIFNVGNSKPIEIIKFINTLEDIIGLRAELKFVEMQPGEAKETFSDNTELYKWIGYKPKISIAKGLSIFINWYKDYFSINK